MKYKYLCFLIGFSRIFLTYNLFAQANTLFIQASTIKCILAAKDKCTTTETNVIVEKTIS